MTQPSPIFIKKASGEKVAFEPQKLLNSLTKAGAVPEVAEVILKQIESELRPGMSTARIYQRAFNLLRKSSRPLAAKYKLKRAVMELGPSGYPFEQYVGALLERQGYKVKVGVTVMGKCVSHEVDVLAEKDNHRLAIECKFGAKAGKRLDVKVPLYIRSRVNDLIDAWREEPGGKDLIYEGWIVTNGMFSGDAQEYGTCSGMTLVSWDFPQHSNLKIRIERSGLYPVTTLVTLTKAEKKILLDKGIILIKSLLDHPHLLESLNVSPTRRKRAQEEIEALCM